jgi:CxxC-x17-CxxC domain-containing protein
MKKDTRPDITELIVNIQRHLLSLESKIDRLNSRFSGSPAALPLGRPHDEGRREAARQLDGQGQRPMYKAICADCNKECEVPFKPSQDRPVYCRECFASRKGAVAFKARRDNKPAAAALPRESPFYKFQAIKGRKSVAKGRPRHKSAKAKRR